MAITDLGAWAPDFPDIGNPQLEECLNLIPEKRGYSSLPEPEPLSTNGTASEPSMLSAIIADNGESNVFAGDASKLYRLDKNTLGWADASKTGGYTTGEERWVSTSFGSYFLASNFNDNIQFFDTKTSTVFADLTTTFRARQLGTVGYFVFAGDTYDAADGSMPNRVRWSAFNDCTDWVASVTTQSDWQDLPSGGRIKRIVGGDHATILSERSIHVAQYTGDKFIFSFQEVVPGLGCISSGSVVQSGQMIFFLGEDHFYAMSGGQVEPISDGFISRWFFDDCDTGNLHKITGSLCPGGLVMWSYPRANGTWGQLIYSLREGKWSHADADVSVMARSYSVGMTLEGLNLFGSLEAVPASLDSRIWKGGQPVWAGLDPSGTLMSFTGSAMPWQIETGAHYLGEGQSRRSLVRNVVPITDCPTVSVQVGSQDTAAEAASWSDTKEVGGDGRARLRQGGRFHRFRISGEGDFGSLTGFEVLASPLGGR